MKLKHLGVIALFLSASLAEAQTYTMTNGTVNTCSGTFYDSGGAGGDYTDNEDFTFTICPNSPGADIQIVFSAFDIESGWDDFYVYDGTSTAAPLIGLYTGTGSPGSITATGASGCLTFRFDSDGSFSYSGWAATISCINPCQTITPSILSTNPVPDGDGIIRLCQNENVNFIGNATFSSSGAGATYEWIMGDGTSNFGTNINDSYPNGGGYVAYLQVTDNTGCVAVSAEQIVEVSTTPVINTSASPSTLCTNQLSELDANVTMTPYDVNCTPPVSGTTFLPDGSGVSYSTDIFTDCYPPGSAITSANDFISICLDLEHSYLGDLDIVFTCPNGQSMVLKAYPGGSGTFLGDPIDDDFNLAAGTPRTYCFTPSASTLLVNGPTSAAGTPAGNSVVAGDYMPVNSFSNLIGCPLNGTWTITVTDNISSDNGYIFNWEFDLVASLTNVTSFTPTIVSQGWQANPELTATSSTTADVYPTAMGSPCYTYEVVDNYDCTYTSDVCLTVGCTSLGAEITEFDAGALDNGSVLVHWVTSMERDNTDFYVERFTPDKVWELIATVPSQGDAYEDQFYQIIDETPYQGVNFYRLISEDMNGEVSISDIRSVHFSSGLSFFPNPAKEQLTIVELPKNCSELTLFDSFGRMIRTIHVENPELVHVDLRELNPGVYMIQFEEKVLRFVKE